MNGESLAHAGILGMKWGVRRYQNADGTLTDAGKKRYASENEGKKDADKKSADANRWAKEDYTTAKDAVGTAKKLTDTAAAESKKLNPKPTTERIKLDKVTNDELRQCIERERLEQQYNDLFAKESTPKISKGKQALDATLETIGPVLTVTSTALSMAIAIQTLKGQMH